MALKVNLAKNYSSLLHQVRETLVVGQRKVEQAKVETYWQTGRLIHEHILQHKDRADYGQKLIEKLADDLKEGDRLLWRTVSFYRAFPRILSGRTELVWTHYRALLTIPDSQTREAFARRAVRESWTAEELEQKIRLECRAEGRKAPAGDGRAVKALKGRRGKLYHYRVLAPGSEHRADTLVLVDLGFQVSVNLDAVTARGLKPGDVVQSVEQEDGSYRAVKEKAAESELFTYKAFVEKVVDGDTLRVKIDLGFDTWIRQYLRLRGVNAPELASAEGRAARDFVKKRLVKAPFIVLTSSRSDKYDRYLADVWLPESDAAFLFLNQALVEAGLAGVV